LDFAVYLVGRFFKFLKQWGLLYLPITSQGNFSVPLALHPSRTVTLCFDFVPPWQNHLCMSMSCWARDYRRIQFCQH
jgi:hypothetical protein